MIRVGAATLLLGWEGGSGGKAKLRLLWHQSSGICALLCLKIRKRIFLVSHSSAASRAPGPIYEIMNNRLSVFIGGIDRCSPHHTSPRHAFDELKIVTYLCDSSSME
jgi:hypothetical protein